MTYDIDENDPESLRSFFFVEAYRYLRDGVGLSLDGYTAHMRHQPQLELWDDQAIFRLAVAVWSVLERRGMTVHYDIHGVATILPTQRGGL